MAKTKYIMYECAYCHKPTKMELVGEMQNGTEEPAQKLFWLTRNRPILYNPPHGWTHSVLSL